MLVLWCVAVTILLLQHAYWRDEVRALSLALQGDTLLEMLRGLHGDGHPAVWHLLLRGAYAIVPTPAVLPFVAAAVAVAAALLLAWRSPFTTPIVALVLLGQLGVYEYSVMARNYGISMLLMFLFATLYRQYRERGIVLGLVLAMLANTNVHSALLVGAFLLFWLLDVAWHGAADKRAALRSFAINAFVAALGIALCFVTVYPPANDAAVNFVPAGPAWRRLAMALFVPGAAFAELGGLGLPVVLRSVAGWPPHLVVALQLLISALLFASVVGLRRRRAAVVAGLVALLALSLTFNFVYVGHYRHQGLWVVFLLAMYWIAGEGGPSRAAATRDRLRDAGLACLVGLLALQVAIGAVTTLPVASGRTPESRSRELAELVRRTPELRNATILADPDYLVESLPYYLPNRTYLAREQRFGSVVRFTRENARLDLYLRDILDDARRLRRETGAPVVILLFERLDPDAPLRAVASGYNWRTWYSPGQVHEFLSSTRRIARFDYVCCNDESYDVYVLD